MLCFWKTSFQFNAGLELVGVEVSVVNSHLCFFGEQGVDSRLPIAFYFARFFVESVSNSVPQLSTLLPQLLSLFATFTEHEVASLRRKYDRFMKSLNVV